MKEENKNAVKKGFLAAAGTASGAAVGKVIEKAVNLASAETEASAVAETTGAVDEASAEVQEGVEVVYAAAPVELDEVVVTAQTVGHAQPTHHSPARPSFASHHMNNDSDEPIMAEVVSVHGAVPAADADIDDDIMVVSEGTEVLDDPITVQINVTAPAPDLFAESRPEAPIQAESTDTPSYISEADFTMRADGSGVDTAVSDTLDMPDYINNANIDSFIDSI